METRICTKCGVEKDLNTDNYHFRQDNQKFRNECKSCIVARNKKYNEDHKDEIAQYKHQWYKDNLDTLIPYRKTYYQENKNGSHSRIQRVE